MKALAIVQARMGSSRFPGKSMADLLGHPILWYLFRQLSFCKNDVTPILATTTSERDDPLVAWAEGEGIAVFRGSEDDVLGRYHDAARAFGATDETPILRQTGDDILPDPRLIDGALELLDSFRGRIDCVFTEDEGGMLPYGLYVECYRFRALRTAFETAEEPSDREHVTPFIRRHRDLFPRLEIRPSHPNPGIPLSIDHPEDLERNEALLTALNDISQPPYSSADILAAIDVIEANR